MSSPLSARCSRCFGEQISVVTHGAMFAANRERLTWRTARNQIHTSCPKSKVMAMHVALDERPVTDKRTPTLLVRANGFASIVIEFKHRLVPEPNFGCRQCQT